MKYIIGLSVISAVICLSCGSSSTTSKGQKTDPHSEMHAEMHREFYQEQNLEKLNARWKIVQLNNTPVDPQQFDDKIPELAFDTTNGTINGNDGCNLFHGAFRIENNKIVFGPMAGTLMACPGSESSEEITKSISEKELTFSLKDSLILYDGLTPVLVLQQVD